MRAILRNGINPFFVLGRLSLFLALLFFNSCDEVIEPSSPSSGSGTSGTGSGTSGSGTGSGSGAGSGSGSGSNSGIAGNWIRNDGLAQTYLNLTGSIAKTCNNGVETVGVYNSSIPNMTFVISGNTLIFPLRMSGDKLIVGVPAGNNTHVDTEYIKSSSWCTGSGGGSGGTGGTTATGKMTFYANADQGSVTVVVNGTSKSFSGFWYPQLPPCGTGSNAANFTLPVGSYSYTATGSSRTWSGTITISKDACNLTTLTSTSGTARTGQAMFWTAVDMKCGAISVTCGGSTKSITGYYTSGIPNCDATSAATFNLNPGTYAWTAKCTSKNWSGTVIVTADGCSTMRLTN